VLFLIECSALWCIKINISLSKKRKVGTECRVFNKKWNNDYFFIEQNNVALCVICKEKVDVMK